MTNEELNRLIAWRDYMVARPQHNLMNNAVFSLVDALITKAEKRQKDQDKLRRNLDDLSVPPPWNVDDHGAQALVFSMGSVLVCETRLPLALEIVRAINAAAGFGEGGP